MNFELSLWKNHILLFHLNPPNPPDLLQQTHIFSFSWQIKEFYKKYLNDFHMFNEL